MEIKVIEYSKKRILFELKDADNTFTNALKKELINDSSVKVATFNIDHPLIGIPKMIIETDGKKDVKKVMTDACSRLKKRNDAFLKKFKSLK